MDDQVQEAICAAYSRAAVKYGELFYYELQQKPLDRKLYDLFYERALNRGICLEIGCGPGEIANYLWAKGLDIIGIDYCSAMVETARSLNSQITYQVGDVFALDFAAETVGSIVAPYLIVHFPKETLLEAIQEIFRVLKNESYLLLSFHIGEDEQWDYHDFLIPNNPVTYYFHKVETVATELDKAGFKIAEVITKSPYQGEVTKRCFIFAQK